MNASECLYEYNGNVDPPLPQISPESYPSDIYRNDTRTTMHFLSSSTVPEQTSPNLNAHFISVFPGEPFRFPGVPCTSHWLYVIEGKGIIHDHENRWNVGRGDILVIPNKNDFLLFMEAHLVSVLYYVNDAPLIHYLGGTIGGMIPRFPSQYFSCRALEEKMETILHDPLLHGKNRLGFLVGNPSTVHTTRTITHVLWTLLNYLPKRSAQRPHRHQSIALDLCVSGGNGKVYTLMGPRLDENGWVKNPIRRDWENGGVFVTPPGWWHSHHNESDEDAIVVPVQDAGLYLYQRTLGIEFSDAN